MTLAPPDPSRATIPGDSEDKVQAHTYAWYDPDAAAYEDPDPLADLDRISDEDAASIFG